MICKIQVVIIGEGGLEETRELACLERTDLKPETLGLTLAEGKMILKGLQQIVVERQVSSSLLSKRACPDCGQPRHSKGNHTLSLRTVFGQITVRSPRLHHCTCRPHQTRTFSPLVELLPEHITPELLFLETKWASLMSYGLTSKLLQEVLPIDEPINTLPFASTSRMSRSAWSGNWVRNNAVLSKAVSGTGIGSLHRTVR
jgi:transposase